MPPFLHLLTNLISHLNYHFFLFCSTEYFLEKRKRLEIYTLGSAYAEFMEDRKGMIKKDYLADMVIYDKNLMKIPPEKIIKALVDYTIVGGKVVHKREGAS